MSKPRIHLVANAHLDPVWLWEWEEGAAHAISTFRSAAELCEEFEAFIFNHNEAVLYKWVEEYEPELFQRITSLVKAGKWHIMGGWYLQPDCNMPGGESFVRQILMGQRYFREKFGIKVRTAINFDPFGHSRGLVQILHKSGYTGYLFCRPNDKFCQLPAEEFLWKGFDGSQVLAVRVLESYLSPLGKAEEKVRRYLELNKGKDLGLVLWGVGNHGGGPSRKDLHNLEQLITDSKDVVIEHSTPEAYFDGLIQSGQSFPVHDKDINPFAVGCYTSMIRVKQKHRQLENELFMVEKMASAAAMQGLIAYPKEEIDAALCDLLFAEFHDILPGSSIQPVEEAALRTMDHGLEILSRVKARTFFVLARGQRKAEEGDIPIFIYNPHPYKVKGLFECEFMLEDQNWSGTFHVADVYQNGKQIPAQIEKEMSNLELDWRKHVVFAAEIEPGIMNRFDCRMRELPVKPTARLQAKNGKYQFETTDLSVVINTESGLVDELAVHDAQILDKNAFRHLVIMDNDDSWEMRTRSFPNVVGAFTLLDKDAGSKFSGVNQTIPSVRVIEDGPVRTVVEAVFGYDCSFICQRYKLPKHGTEIEIEIRVHWNEKAKMLKWSLPTRLKNSEYLGQTAFGVMNLPDNGDEAVAQKWTAVVSRESNLALTCINDGIYGSDFRNGELRISLLRSPAFSGHPSDDKEPLISPDRYTPRIDQGERIFRLYLNGGPIPERMDHIDREALVKNEKPFALSFFPPGVGKLVKPAILLDDNVIQLTALKKAEDNDDWIIRLFEPTGKARETMLSIPFMNIRQKIKLKSFEIMTLRLDISEKMLYDVDLLELKSEL